MTRLVEFDEMHRFLVVVDMQNDFIDGSLGTSEAPSIVSKVVSKIKEVEDEARIVYTMDTHNKFEYLNTEEGKNLSVFHCVEGTPGWCLNKDVFDALPRHAECIEKNTFGALDLTKSLHPDPFSDTIFEVVGLCTDICVLANVVAIKMAFPRAHVIVDAACCAGTSPENHDIAIRAMKNLQVEVINEWREPWRMCNEKQI